MTTEAVGLPVPQSDDRNLPFWQAASDRRFVIARCSNCGHLMAPPVTNCTACLHDEVEWVSAAGGGQVYSFVEYFRAWIPEFLPFLPYTVAIVELDEGPRMITIILRREGQNLTVGDRVTVTFQDRGAGSQVPIFEHE